MWNLRMFSCLTVSAGASSWPILVWPDAWGAAWNGWVVPSPIRRQRCAVQAVPRVSLWPPVWMCGRSVCWSSVCWQAISPGRQRCPPTPSMRSFDAGRKQGALWEHTRLNGGASLMMPCVCFRGCSLLSRKNAVESRTSSALSSTSWWASSGAEHLAEPREVRGQARECVPAVVRPPHPPLQLVPPTDTLNPPLLQEHPASVRHHSNVVFSPTHCLPERSLDSTNLQAETRTKARWWWQLPSKSVCDHTTMLAVETRWLFTVITSCEEVLMTTTETLVKKRGTLTMKEKLRIASATVEMDIINQRYTLGQLITGTCRFGFDLWPKTASRAEKPCRQCLRVCWCCPSQQLILPSRHLLCFLPIHCGGANDSIIRYSRKANSVFSSLSVFILVFMLRLFTSVYYKLQGGQNFIWCCSVGGWWSGGNLRNSIRPPSLRLPANFQCIKFVFDFFKCYEEKKKIEEKKY